MATLCHLPPALGAVSLRLQHPTHCRTIGVGGTRETPSQAPVPDPWDFLPSHHPPDPSMLTTVVPQSFPGNMGTLPQHRLGFSMSSSPIMAISHPGSSSCATSWDSSCWWQWQGTGLVSVCRQGES